MRIGIDIRCLTEGRRTGVEEYTLNLLENLFELDKENDYVLFLNSFSKPKFDLERFDKNKNVKVKMLRIPNKILNFLFWYFHWPKIDRLLGGVDIFFMPNINFGAFSKDVKLILTIHDLSFEYYGETFSLKRRLWHAFVNPRALVRSVDKIIAVSNSTGNDLVSRYGVNENKIEVITSSVSDSFRIIDKNNPKIMETKEEYNLPYKFILYLGTIEPRKNIIGLLRAYNNLRKENNPDLDKYKLVIAGGKGWKYEKIFSEIVDSPYQEDILVTGYICDMDKEYVYNLASIFVYPTFFEGFGFPPLEAMRCGVPVIASNVSSIPEIVGDGGVLIDPDKPDEIYQAMKEVLSSKELQARLRKRGLSQSMKFSWRRAAKEFLGVINEL